MLVRGAMRVLAVEDDPALADLLRRRLCREEHVVDVAPDGALGLQPAESRSTAARSRTTRAREHLADGGESTAIASLNTAFATLHLLPAAPPELVAAYRVMVKVSHPDAGGSHGAMVRINNAISLIREYGAAPVLVDASA